MATLVSEFSEKKLLGLIEEKKIEKGSVHNISNNDSKERASVELNLSEIGWKDSQLIEKIGSDIWSLKLKCNMLKQHAGDRYSFDEETRKKKDRYVK